MTMHLFHHRVMLMMPSEGPAFLHSLYDESRQLAKLLLFNKLYTFNLILSNV